MTLNVGSDFKQRWLTAPQAVRQTFMNDLHRICEVLQPETQLHNWIAEDQRAQQQSQEKIEQAYADLKARLLEEARQRRQLALELKLEQQRAEQAAYAAQLQQDEAQRFAEQTQALELMRQSLDQEISNYTARYEQNPELPAVTFNQAATAVSDDQIVSELESVRLRLELEAETQIEQAVTIFRARLHAAAQEEIDYILKNSNFSKE
ncbi:cell division protein BlhA [Acinetobacter towneri]|uniref:ATPase n=1 Tax=Acinetobacter towneri TaxID=202956 RepID=A0AB35M048_9GAMM|nr:hypothetical protein [Acinetobacter towneri]MDM1718999.1 hypothetical protein [Acinetobacter towneri]MDM1731128.1 hypothetical protein [Acinetobacter towneri]MDM1733827.1 hypothetical protein [Acinetobacter towneri]MDM1739127.1 hypothetical protein [Acinetobacter towneri]MDM1741864.1 hypothetical protein [Acinetobacter towneri]